MPLYVDYFRREPTDNLSIFISNEKWWKSVDIIVGENSTHQNFVY